MKKLLLKGFSGTFILLIVATTSITLSFLVPYYMHFVALSKRTEAFLNLDLLCASQQKFFEKFGTYSQTLQGPESINWKPTTRSTYSYGFYGDKDTHYIEGRMEGDNAQIFSEVTYANKEGFTAAAIADLDGDGVLDIITIDHLKNITILLDDLL